MLFVFFKHTSTTAIYTYCPTLSLHDALPICRCQTHAGFTQQRQVRRHLPGVASDDAIADGIEVVAVQPDIVGQVGRTQQRSEEHTSELQSLMRNSYADFCLQKKTYRRPPKNGSQHERGSR